MIHISRANPAGIMRAEIWFKIGGAPTNDDSDVTFLTVDTRSSCTADYGAAESNPIARYTLRGITPRSERAPWSETVSATIGR